MAGKTEMRTCMGTQANGDSASGGDLGGAGTAQKCMKKLGSPVCRNVMKYPLDLE
jgi:hypothetical protein